MFNNNSQKNIKSQNKDSSIDIVTKLKSNSVNPLRINDAVEFITHNPRKDKILASTQDHLDIYDIRDNVVLLKNGDVALVIETTAVNFQLLSSYEQDLKISAYTELINSLNFELQIVIHTEPIDMKKYLDYLKYNYQKQKDFEMREYMKSYIEYVRDLVIENNILQKRFFVIVPHRSGVLTSSDINPLSKVTDFILGRKRVVEIKNADELIEKALLKLIPKRDHLMKMLARMSLGSKQLNNEELVQLYFSYYNDIEKF